MTMNVTSVSHRILVKMYFAGSYTDGSSVVTEKEGKESYERLRMRRARLKRDGTCAETRFGLSAKRTSPFKSAGVSVQSTTGSRGVCISGSNAGYTMF